MSARQSYSGRTRTVLIPLDGSPASDAAFQWYLANLRRDGDYVIVVHIVEPPSLPAFSLKSGFSVPADSWRDIILESSKKAKAMEEEMSQRSASLKLKIEFIAESSRKPGEAIVDIARRTQCDAIVMAARVCYSDVRRAFLGSVSDYVLHHSQLPVSIVPGGYHLQSAAAADATAGVKK